MNVDLDLMFYREQYQHIVSSLMKAGWNPAEASLTEWLEKR